jgi:hypothetical protein
MWLPLLLACSPAPRTADYPSSQPIPGGDAVDLVSPLGPDEARAGVITDEAALFGGLAAEGQVGDVKIYNDRAQFVLQGLREGAYYIRQGGGLIDADIVRPAGQPGRDIVDEFTVMVGLGRILAADAITVVHPGGIGEAAVVEVTSHGEPMSLLTGALEKPDFVADIELVATTRYTLAPGSALLEVETTLTWMGDTSTLLLGDIGFFAQDGADNWDPGRGLDDEGEADGGWFGAVGWKNEVAFALLSEETFPPSAAATVLSAVGPVMAGFQPSATLGPGDTVSFRRFFGVGPSLSTLTDAWYRARGVDTESVGGVVEAGGAPLAGARLTLLDGEGRPVTLAQTDAAGAWSAQVPAGLVETVVASGRGHAIDVDLPAGAGWSAPYAADTVDAAVAVTLVEGADPIAFAEGYGLSDAAPAGASMTHSLTPPGRLEIDVGDGLPAVARVDFLGGDPVAAKAGLAPGRPGGAAGLLFLRDGQGSLAVEPGAYRVVVHRGYRYEAFSAEVTVESGGQQRIAAPLARVVAPAGALAIDPHAHGGPSNDSKIPMEDRLIVAAAHGVQVHFGTDHDNVADYGALIAPLGLEEVLRSVIADEVSTVMRGHFNLYPLKTQPNLPNQGAPPWYENSWDTPTLFAQMRERLLGEPGIIQVNHPEGSSGMFGNAGYDVSTGQVASEAHWTEDFDAVEVLNGGNYTDYLPFYLDLTARGLWPTPVGVSDSHSHTDGPGESVTWLFSGVDSPAALTNATLVQALGARATVVSRGPFVEATIDGQRAPGGLFTGEPSLSVEVWAPSWVSVEAVDLLRDGEVVETQAIDPDATEALRAQLVFALAGEEDAVYVLIARGSRAMAPVYPGVTAWAMSSALRVDRAGDGWTAPLPALVVGGP